MKQEENKSKYSIFFGNEEESKNYVKLANQLAINSTENQPKHKFEDGYEVYRPLTLKETLVALIVDKKLFEHLVFPKNNVLTTSTGIIYRPFNNACEAKIISESKDIITAEPTADDYISYAGYSFNDYPAKCFRLENTKGLAELLQFDENIPQTREILKEVKDSLVHYFEDARGRKLTGQEYSRINVKTNLFHKPMYSDLRSKLRMFPVSLFLDEQNSINISTISKLDDNEKYCMIKVR
jgi:hypothetical protein